MGEAAVLRLHRRPAHGRKAQLAQGGYRQWGSCETGSGQPAFIGRPAHVEAAARLRVSHAAEHEEPAGVTNLSATGRRTPTDQVKTRRKGRAPSRQSNGESDRLPTPDRCPATEAINSQPPDGCPTGEGLITPTAGLDRGRRAKPTPSFRPALPAKDQRQLRFGSIPSWATGGERIILRSCPCNRDHAPRFLWSETLEKAKQRSHYHPARHRDERACRPPSADCGQSVHKS